MDSPERDSNASSSSAISSSTSSAFQDSSFLNYLSALSPINPSKPTNVGQALAELNFPPPPPVFTSPRVNPRRETSYLKRSQYLNTSAKDPSLNFIPEGKILEKGPNIYGPYGTQCTVDLIRCTQNESGDKASVQVQPCSPSGCVDQFLADTLEECANSDSPDLCSRHATDTPQEIQNVCNSPKGTTGPVVSDNNDDGGQNLSNKNESTEAIRDVIRAGGSEQKNDGRQPNRWDNSVSEGFQCIEADLPMGSTSSKQNDEVAVNKTAKQFPSFLLCNRDCDIGGSENEISIHVSNLQSDETKEVMAHPAESGQRGNCNQEWLPESFGIVKADFFHDGNIGAVSSGTVENMISYACKETSQYQRGMRRRCLQFEATEAHRKSLENCSSSWNKASIDHSEMRCDSSMGSEALNTHDAVSYMTSTNKQVIKSSSHASSRLSSCSLETPESHIDNFNSSVRTDGSSPVASSVPSGIGLHLNSIVNVGAASCEINSELPGNELAEKLLCGSDCSTQEDLRGALVPYEIESHVSRDACRLELLQASPRKKRKREPNTLESEGCKRCNCKKTKCLKLYCDCFAAGVYCAEACTCHECFNKPEYEDTVLGTRQQIESRNPLAFAPKIVRSVTQSPQDNEDDNRATPASARHKRGCNCKKSMCLKKYCECYQAGVGCSDGCRCESCKNVFGKKEDMEHRKDKDERWEDVSDMKLRTDASQPEQWHPDNLSPLIQCSKKSISESRHLTGSQQASSPNSEVSLLSSYGKVPNSQQTSDRNYRLKKVKEGNEGQVLYHQALDYQKACDVDPFLARWDGRLDIHEYTQLQLQPQSGASASLASDMYPSKALQAYLCQESGNSSVGSLRWLGSPASPNPCFNGSKFVIGPNSDNRLYNIVEDETPHILKETDSVEAVKVNSPNKKRISPPHNSLHELTRSNSSPVLKSARKFILQSVPSFPSLSPYSEPNESEEP